MPAFKARERCPDLVFVPPRFDVYRAVSAQIRAVFTDYTPLVEPLSLDEAYLDVTANLRGLPTATATAREIRARIRETTGLTASAGVSCNKFLAKLASDQNKPDGLFVIRPEEAAAFVAPLPVGKFHGIGPVTAARMNAMGIATGLDLRAKTLEFLEARFGKAGAYFHQICRGVDDRPVRPDRVRKSIGSETTFERDIADPALLEAAMQAILDKVWAACGHHRMRGRTVTLKLRFADFSEFTRRRSTPDDVPDRAALGAAAGALLREALPPGARVRLLGVTLSNLDDEETARLAPRQMSLFD